MGYYIQTEQVEMFISKSFFAPACRLLESQGVTEDHPAMTGGMWTAGSAERVKKWWAWVNMDLLRQAIVNNDLPEVLRLFRFSVEQDVDGSIVGLDFDCKMGNEEALFRIIAPYCHGEIVWRGEEDEEWVWEFSRGELLIRTREVFRTTLAPDDAEKFDKIKDTLRSACYLSLLDALSAVILHFNLEVEISSKESEIENVVILSHDGKPVN